MRNSQDRALNGWALCTYNGEKDHFRKIHMEGDRNQASNHHVDDNYVIKTIKALVYILKIIITFCLFVIGLFIDFASNKWMWNVTFIVINIVLDIFFQLVLALAAIMVVLILNIDDLYQQVQNEKFKDLKLSSNNNQKLNIIEEESCPNLV